MKLIIGGQYYSTPEGSTMRLTGSASDPVPTCTVSIRDNASAINIIPPQELIVLDEQVIPNPTINLALNPTMNPDNTNWSINTSFAGVTTAQNGGGGVIITTNNYSGGSRAMIMSQGPIINALVANQWAVVPGQTYVFSVYGQANAFIAQAGASMIILWLDANGNSAGQTAFADGPIPAPTTLTRYSVTGTAPANAAFFLIEFGMVFSSPSNGGAITFTNAQMEPLWFPTIAYPTPFCGPAQTNCVQLPLGQWIRQYRKFAGFVTKTIPGDYHGNVRTIQVQAAGYAWLLSGMIGNDTFSSKTDKQVITTLVGKYLLSNGVAMTTTTNVIQGVTVSSTQLNWDDLRAAHDSLCGLSGFYWTIDFYWNVIYAPPGYFNMAISLICDNSSIPDMITTFPAYNFKAENDFTQPGSNIIVLGNGVNTAQTIDPSRVAQLGLICGYSLPPTTSWMRKVNDSTLNSVADCTQRGMAELIQYDSVRGLYHLTANVELIAGQGVRVTSNTDGLNQSMLLIQQVTATWLGTTETLTDFWEYQADLGAVNRAATNIISRIFRQTNKNTAATAINTVTLAVLENVGVIDQVDGNSTYAQTVLADSPVRYFRLGEPAGYSITTAYDWSGNVQNGTIAGGVTLGQSGLLYNDSTTAMLFDGSSGNITIPTTGLPSGTSPWSIECWVEMPTVPGSAPRFRPMVSIGTLTTNNGFIFYYDTQLHQFGYGPAAGSNILGGATPANGSVHHVVCTCDGTNTSTAIKLYVDGVQVATGLSGSSTLSITYGTAKIATDPASDWFGGVLQECAIYASVLTAPRVLTHYIAGTRGTYSSIYMATILALSPVGYFRLGEPGGTTAADSSGNAFNGTIAGGVTLGQPGAITLDTNDSMLFNGTTGKIDIASGLSTTGFSALTLEAWINLSTTTFTNVRVLSNDHTSVDNKGCELILQTNAVGLTLALGNGTTNLSLAGTFAFSANQWYHIAGAWSAATGAVLYVNGTQIATGTLTGTIAAATNNMGIVYAPNTSTNFFPGYLDEVAVYQAKLTQAQAQQHYNLGTLGHS